jgi:hypothetical protein
MSQVTIYLDEETARSARAAAAAAGLSVSRWITDLIRDRAATEWPRDVAALAGVWPDFPLAEGLRQGPPTDMDREEL